MIAVQDHRVRGIILLIMTALLWSLGGLFVKLIDWNAMAIAGTRSGIAAVVILLYLRQKKFTWSKYQLWGAVAYCATVMLYVVGNKLTTAANTILLQYTSPIWVALFGGWFLGERVKWRDWLFIAAVLGGMVLFFLDHITATNLWGNIAALISGISFGWLTLLMRKQKEGSPVETVLLGNVLTFLIALPFMARDPLPPSGDWGYLLLLGIFQLGLSYILFAEAIKHVAALSSNLIAMIEPILNPLWVLLIIGEVPGPWAVVGGVIILGTVTVRAVKETSSKP
ncbi:MAG: DMT family transporter [Fidelibacterota bacterium]